MCFSDDRDNVRVLIGGSACVIFDRVDAMSDNQIICNSGSRTPSIFTNVVVIVNGKGAAIDVSLPEDG